MNLLIAGAGGHGRVVADTAAALQEWSEIAFLDDRYPAVSSTGPWAVIGRVADLESYAGRYNAGLAAFGDCALRLAVLARLRQAGFVVPVLIHPRATVSPHAQLDAGTVVLAGAVVNIGAVLGLGCIVNTGATVDHDCRLQDGVHVCPGVHLAGGVAVGTETWFGIGAAARQGIRIGARVVVGAGAVCLDDVDDGVTVTGVPARELKR